MESSKTIEEKLKLLCEKQEYEEATKLAVRRYGPEILGWLINITKEGVVAEDICQQFCIVLWQNLPSFRWESSLRIWSYRVAWRELARFQKAQKKRQEFHLPTPQFIQLSKQLTTSIESYIQNLQKKERLIELRQELSNEMQSLLVLRVDREMTFEEIAEVFDISKENARQKFKRAKDKLKEMVRKEGLLKQ